MANRVRKASVAETPKLPTAICCAWAAGANQARRCEGQRNKTGAEAVETSMFFHVILPDVAVFYRSLLVLSRLRLSFPGCRLPEHGIGRGLAYSGATETSITTTSPARRGPRLGQGAAKVSRGHHVADAMGTLPARKHREIQSADLPSSAQSSGSRSAGRAAVPFVPDADHSLKNERLFETSTSIGTL